MEFPDHPDNFKIGQSVAKVIDRYTFKGVVRAVFTKNSGLVCYVVEDDRGVLHIYSHENLRAL